MTWPQPIGEPQSSIDDTWACSNFAECHSLESQIKFHTGKTVNLSERFLAIMSGTIPGTGNSISKVFATVEKYGWLENSDCPHPTGSWTNAEYYSFDITPELLAKALKNKEDWDIDYRTALPNTPQTLKLLDTAPLIAWVPALTANHFVEVLDAQTRFDSYLPYRRPLGSVQNFSQFIIKRKDTMKLVNNNGTYYLEGNKGYFGINKPEFLNLLIKITDQVENRAPVGSQLGVIETTSDVFRIK